MNSQQNNNLDLSQFAPRKYLSVPNLISLIRLALIPLMLWLYLEGKILIAVILVIVSGITDAIDGYIARHFNQITPLGKVLDPLADKLTQLALCICLLTHFPAVIPLVVVLVIKELLMLHWGLRLLKAGRQPFSALWWGKLSTCAFYAGVLIIMIFYPEIGMLGVVLITLIITLLLINSMCRYYLVFRRKIAAAD